MFDRIKLSTHTLYKSVCVVLIGYLVSHFDFCGYIYDVLIFYLCTYNHYVIQIIHHVKYRLLVVVNLVYCYLDMVL